MAKRKPLTERAPFQPVDLDEVDSKLAATASRKGIPTLQQTESTVETSPAPKPETKQPVAPRKTLTVQVPDYLWIELKTEAARQMVSVRHLVLSTLQKSGFEIRDEDLVEDGRRLR